MKKHLREEIQLMQKKRPYNVLKSDIKKGTGRTGRVISQIKQN